MNKEEYKEWFDGLTKIEQMAIMMYIGDDMIPFKTLLSWDLSEFFYLNQCGYESYEQAMKDADNNTLEEWKEAYELISENKG